MPTWRSPSFRIPIGLRVLLSIQIAGRAVNAHEVLPVGSADRFADDELVTPLSAYPKTLIGAFRMNRSGDVDIIATGRDTHWYMKSPQYLSEL